MAHCRTRSTNLLESLHAKFAEVRSIDECNGRGQCSSRGAVSEGLAGSGIELQRDQVESQVRILPGAPLNGLYQPLPPSTERSGRTLCLVGEGAFATTWPPVPVAEDTHGGGNEQNADDRRIYENGHGEAEADRFGNDDAAKGERAGHDDDNGGC
jgi:hypothetical protein